jgi:hypothetical protein
VTDAPSLFDFVPPTPNVSENAATKGNDAAAIALLLEQLATDGELTRQSVTAVMTRVYGGTDADGAWTARMAYNRAETVLAWKIIDRKNTLTLKEIEDLQERVMITQARRSIETVELQQFSTPATIGWLAARAARLREEDIVLEPSAGCGLLAAHVTACGASVVLNEIDEDRLSMLATLPLKCAGPILDFDAKFLRAFYGTRSLTRPSLVLMNPPFSSDGNANSGPVGIRHVEQAFGLLRAGGRLVAILGAYDDPITHPERFQNVLAGATLRASIAIDPRAYAKFGTATSVRIIVIDKTKADGQQPVLYHDPVLLGRALDYVDAVPPRAGLPGGDEEAVQTQTLSSSTRVIRGIPGILRRVSSELVEYQILERQADTHGGDTGIFENYVPKRVVFPNAKPHPDPIVESTSLHAVLPPTPTSKLLLPRWVVEDGVLSDVQLETVLYACDAHEKHIDLEIPTIEGHAETVRARLGYLIGDGGGVGKGRQLAGIIRNFVSHGGRRVLWVSETEALLEDAQRDWVDLGGRAEEVVPLNRWPVNTAVPLTEAIIFTTYATLRSKSQDGVHTRVKQIGDWLDPDSVIVFDEAHNGGNAASVKSDRGTTGASQQGMAMLEIQRAKPDARIVYASATAASEPNNLSYAERGGLWGKNTAFHGRTAFIAEITRAGLAALEIVCRNMVSQGVYCARTLSPAGITYERLPCLLTDDQKTAYATYNTAWRMIVKHADASLESNNADGRTRGQALSRLYSTMQRFYQAVLISFKMPTVIEHARGQLEKGNSIVFQLTSTNEAVQERSLAARDVDADLDDIDLSPRDLIFDYLENAFPTIQYEEYQDDGEIKTRPLMRDGNIVQNPEAVERREQAKAEIATLLCPEGVIDMVLNEFGVEQTAEITGRKRRLIYKSVNGERTRVIEDRPSGSNIAETNAFMDDKKHVLIFSAAGGTGRSYHADRRRKNQQKRIHYPLQFGWRIETAMQGLFRTHRTNQAQEPHYVLPFCPDVEAEKRFVATIVREFEAMGAMTRGQRDAAGTELFSAGDNLETPFAVDAMRGLFNAIEAGTIEGMTLGQFHEQTGLGKFEDGGLVGVRDDTTMQRFLNRMLAVDLDKQHLLIQQLFDRLADIVAQAHAEGKLDEGVRRLRSLALRVDERIELSRDSITDASTELLKLVRTDPALKFPFENTLARLRRYEKYHRNDSSVGFYETEADGICAVIPLLSGEQSRYGGRRGWIITPDSERLEELYRYRNDKPEYGNYEKAIPSQDAAAKWAAIAAQAERRETTFHAVIGDMLRVWDKLPTTGYEVFRATTDDGEPLLMRVIDESEIDQMLVRFGKTAGALNLRTGIARALTGAQVQLSNGWVLKRVRVNNSLRLEVLKIPSLIERKQTLSAAGYMIECIDYRWRCFIPSGRELEILAKDVDEESPVIALAA